VSEGLITLAEDMTPEANRLIELRPHALQHQIHTKYEIDMSLSTLAEYRLVANSISDAMPNSHIKGEAIHSEELLKHIAISTDNTKVVRCSSY
jgi:hypothetical protein